MIAFAPSALLVLLFAWAVPAIKEDVCSSTGVGQSNCHQASTQASDEVNLMQLALSAYKRGRSLEGTQISDNHADSKQRCSDLANKGAYFTATVQIGTPEQEFNLVADTGSDALIIPDCRCLKSGYCEKASSCFATENSTSFGLDVQPEKHHDALAVMGAKMNYGSGQIQVLVASESVRVANIKSTMHNGVFLMEDRRSLKVHGDFEGILGLGLPHEKKITKNGLRIPAFMQSSGTPKYSLCFNEFPHAGAFHTALDSLPEPLTNIGTVHWGLDLQGFSVGNSTAPVLFCDPDKKAKNQTTACGAIPDSGTTLMMGPAKHIRLLYGELCKNWTRCEKAATKANKTHPDHAKAFNQLLYSCADWITKDKGVNEIPSIFIHLAGKEGKAQTVELSAWSYIVETSQELYKVVTAKVFGDVPIAAAIDTGKKKKLCTASFGPQDYNTKSNGPVWIMGAPLFYATSVGFDLGDKGINKPKIAFIKGPCTACKGNKSLIETGSATREASETHVVGQPRRLWGPIREPGIDMSGPF